MMAGLSLTHLGSGYCIAAGGTDVPRRALDAIAATVPDPTVFRSGRDFAAWIGLVPPQDSTGGKQKLGPISKQGDRYLRRILIVGAIAVLRRAQESPGKYPWLTQLLARRPFNVVAVALANKVARILGR
jgi:transposase